MRLLILFIFLIAATELQAQNVGINLNQPVHARLETNGSVGASTAMLGTGEYGMNFSADNPELGFNYFYNNGTKTIKAGYAAYLGMSPGNGDIYLGGFGGNVSSSNFGSISGAQECMRIRQNGNIGIGTSNPGYPLTVKSQFSGAGIVLENLLQTEQVGFWTATNAAYVQTWSNTDLIFSTNSGAGPRFILHTNGNAELEQSLELGKEINTPQTGGANAVPIAYGKVAGDGTILNATANVSVNKIGNGQYEVSISGQPNMYLDNIFYYVFVTTNAKTATSLIKANNTIEINCWNYQFTYTNLVCSGPCLQSKITDPAAQVKNDAEFSFVVYKY